MTHNKKVENFKSFASRDLSGFLEKFTEYEKNSHWLERSSEIAVNILLALKDQALSQKELADKMNISAQQVSKIVKGQQNLTLETIGKIELALGIVLLDIVDYKNANTVFPKQNILKTETLQKMVSGIIPSKEVYTMNDQIYRTERSMKVVYKGNDNEYLNVG